MFGLYIKDLRLKQQIGLRKFCLKHGHDPGNWSKIEREVLPPPRDDATLRAWARQLGLKPDTENWKQFFNYAATDSGRIPPHVLNTANDKEIATGMPQLFRGIQRDIKQVNGEVGNYSTWCKAVDLKQWADTLKGQQKLPALVRKLIHATIENPNLCQFPADEGTRRHGWDGVLIVERGNAWVPKGKSVWEMGTDQKPDVKANGDYKKRSKDRDAETKKSTFVFVTPRKWEGKTKWLKAKRAEKKWQDILVWDGDDLEQWLETAPAVDAWLARLLGKLPKGVRDISSHWSSLSATTDPPLPVAAFLAGRSKAEKDLREALRAEPAEIAVSAPSLAELRDFVSAVLSNGDEEAENAGTARVLVVETVDAWNQLCTAKNRLVLIPSDQLVLEKLMVAEAVKAGHHVVTQRPYTVVRSEKGIRVPRIDRWEVQKALEITGFSEERASRLAREAGGSTSVLVRLGSKFKGQAAPAWSKPQESAALLPLVLIGAWSDRNEEDRKLVEHFTGQSYFNIQHVMTHWMNQPDAPVRLAEGVYSFVSREDSWQLLSPVFTADLLNRFAEIAKEILSEDDPRFHMPVNEHHLAGIYKKLPKYSAELRVGVVETVALLGARGEHTPQGVPEGSSWRAQRLVIELLTNATPERWFSLASNLPLLAEAAPEEFLSALEKGLENDSPVSVLFEKNADGLFSWSPHTSLMWALQILAWDTSHLARVVLILAKLIKLDTGGRINPRPDGVMFDIFRFWFPQTAATLEERLQVLDMLSKREPEIAWKLLLGLIPQGHDTAMATVKPRWREWDSSQTKRVSDKDRVRQAEWAANRLLEIAETHPEKWPSLLEQFDKLPPLARDATLKWLRDIELSALSEAARLEAWNYLRELVQKHRFFQNTWWLLPKDTVDQLAETERKFSPSDPLVRSEWIFDSRAFEAFGNINMPYEEMDRLQTDAQARAVQEVFEALGLNGIFDLASRLKFPAPVKIGELLEKSGLLPDWRNVLPEKLVSENDGQRLVALGYAASKQKTAGAAWVEKLPLEEWPAKAVGEFALALNFERKTWRMLQQRKPDAEPFYWQRVRPWSNFLSEDELEEMIRALLRYGRPRTAVDALSSAINAHKKKPNWKLVADAVELALSSPSSVVEIDFSSHIIWELCEAIKYLQADPTADQERLVRLEWGLLPLARHDHFEPKILHTELSKNPGFFVEVLSAIFRSKNEPKKETTDIDPGKKALGEAAYYLLDSWTGIPGRKADGTIDSATLGAWVAEARRQCLENGRIEICDSKIGEQLSYAPAESDGSWPCQAVRDVFETVMTDEIISGFGVGVFNQRGVTTRGLNDGGEQERDLVKKYRTYAERFKISSPRMAVALRRVAEHYEAQAKWQDEHAESRQ